MEALVRHEGVAALMNRANVDTDQIIPKQFLKKISRTGFGEHLFHDWRYLDDAGTQDDPSFELNKEAFKGASILVAGDNFGCGSSREHAPWALDGYGFKVIISTSFADIFYSNCFKNGMLPIKVSEQELSSLMDEISANEGVKFVVDLEAKEIQTPGGLKIAFDVDDFRRNSLLKGLDDIGWTLQYEEKIKSYEESQKQSMPWLWTA